MAFRYSSESELEIYRMGFSDALMLNPEYKSDLTFNERTEQLFKERAKDLARLKTNDRPLVKNPRWIQSHFDMVAHR